LKATFQAIEGGVLRTRSSLGAMLGRAIAWVGFWQAVACLLGGRRPAASFDPVLTCLQVKVGTRMARGIALI
jgi:hypothetical protein